MCVCTYLPDGTLTPIVVLKYFLFCIFLCVCVSICRLFLGIKIMQNKNLSGMRLLYKQFTIEYQERNFIGVLLTFFTVFVFNSVEMWNFLSLLCCFFEFFSRFRLRIHKSTKKKHTQLNLWIRRKGIYTDMYSCFQFFIYVQMENKYFLVVSLLSSLLTVKQNLYVTD